MFESLGVRGSTVSDEPNESSGVGAQLAHSPVDDIVDLGLRLEASGFRV